MEGHTGEDVTQQMPSGITLHSCLEDRGLCGVRFVALGDCGRVTEACSAVAQSSVCVRATWECPPAPKC